jgi:Flp pilus assembly protein protease CpaA
MPTLEMILTVSVAAVAAVTDTKKRIIPNRLVFPAIGLALFLQLIQQRLDHLIIAMIGCSLLYLLYTFIPNFIGGGDIKLIFFLALMIGPDMSSLIYATAIYTAVVWVYFYIKELRTKEKQFLPLALPLFLGLITNLVGW